MDIITNIAKQIYYLKLTIIFFWLLMVIYYINLQFHIISLYKKKLKKKEQEGND